MTDWTAELCRHLGIGAEYRSFEGQHVFVSPETQKGVLAAMGHDVGSDAEARALLEHLREYESRHPACTEIIVDAGEPASVEISRSMNWRVEAEDTAEDPVSGRASERIELPPMPLGIHRLVMSDATGEWVTWVLARPSKAVSLVDRTGDRRVWGVTTALYGLTDGGKVSIGSFSHLGGYGAALAEHGADFIGINPIHAMGQVRPDAVVSPYSPSHREFLNTWHVGTTGFANCASGDRIDYRAALKANEQALQADFKHFQRLPKASPEAIAFRAFEQAGGSSLDDYVLFEVLARRFGADWRDWPLAFRAQEDDTIDAFRRDHGQTLRYFKWAQWQADCQVGAAQARAVTAGMRIGLYLDLAVGPRLGSAETWAHDTQLITGASLGAPPDPLSPAGQNWGLAPLSPVKCRAQGYAGFGRLLRAVMRHAGMIRIDHVLGLMRSFWIPEGSDEGAYVSYPVDALLAVVAIESLRTGTIVIGEDLGLVPDGLREKLARSGIYGMEILQFLRDGTGGFADTAHIREKAICAFSTHDTPTINGFFAAEDARLQADIGALDTSRYAQIRADRTRAKESLGEASAVDEIHHRLAVAGSELVAVQLDDIAGRMSQQNLPGTIDEHPNWQRVAPFAIKEIQTSKEFARLGAEMARAGRANPSRMDKDHDLPDRANVTH